MSAQSAFNQQPRKNPLGLEIYPTIRVFLGGLFVLGLGESTALERGLSNDVTRKREYSLTGTAS